jgi:Papain fold toxin 1, glutamine deamidase
VGNTWHGKPAAAADLRNRVLGEPTAFMAEWAGVAPAPASMADVGRRLRELGPGSSAVVGFDKRGDIGHWFNAVNHAGTILAVDGQSGKLEKWPPSKNGLGFDESEISGPDAIYFTADGGRA